MSSLAEQLTELLDPKVKSIDPEDDIFEETRAKLVERDDLDSDDSDSTAKNRKIGGRRMQSLDSMGASYKGKVVSRREIVSDEDFSDDDEDEEDTGFQNSDNSSNLSVEDPDGVANGLKSDSDEEMEPTEDQSDMENQDGMDEEIDSDEADGDEGLQIFKAKPEANPLSKGKAIRNQLKLWECMLESRIKCQKLLSLSNRLPHPDTMSLFTDQAKSSVASTDKVLSTVLLKLLEFQAKLLAQNSQTKSIANLESCSKKRKATTPIEEIDGDIQNRFLAMTGFRNKVLKLWYDKTRLTGTSGNMKSKSFEGFERSTISQIEDILHDKERLIKRTQLMRSDYRILGTGKSTSSEPETQTETNHNSHLKNVNEEIFDDDDFYHQLLRQLIEQKSSGVGGSSDPVELTRQWLRIQRLRTKVKKNVDTKASKGRKIRYEIHQKLQSFMAPNDKSSFSNEARNLLFKSLFGNTPECEAEH